MNEKQLIIESRLATDWDFCSMCLLKLYEQQTDDEQDIGDTQHENGKGFNKADATLLSHYTIKVKYEVPMNNADKAIAKFKLKKYAKQLTTLLTDEEIEL